MEKIIHQNRILGYNKAQLIKKTDKLSLSGGNNTSQSAKLVSKETLNQYGVYDFLWDAVG